METFRKFLLTIDKNSVEVPKPNIDLVAVRQSFKKTELHHLDGMDGLINELGEKGLVKLAIETSLFFHKDIVIERFDQMCSKRDEEEPLPARKSTQINTSMRVILFFILIYLQILSVLPSSNGPGIVLRPRCLPR